MTRDEVLLRSRFLIGNYRNLVYYCSLDVSERSTYIHQVRGFRKKAKELVDFLEDSDPQKQLFTAIISSCSAKIKSEECREWILNTLDTILKKWDETQN